MAGSSNPTRDLAPKQARAVAALLVAADIQSAARVAGVGERTLHTWLADPTFKEALKEAERVAIDNAQRRLAGVTQHAISVVLSIMTDKQHPAGVRLRAAGIALDQMLKLRQYAELEDRVATLEAMVNKEKGASK